MSSRFLSSVLLVAAALMAMAHRAHAADRVVRFCVDPDNLPYSNQDGRGFEVRLARLVASEMGARAELVWFPLRRAFVRKTLGAGLCDVIPGVPAAFERVLATRPYYRSSYAFVSRRSGPGSFDDPRLHHMRIGVQLVGNDLAATPPGHALTRRGVVDNVRGYAVYGDGPAPQRMVDALAAGELDCALIWGPQAGYFAARAPVPLEVHVVHAPADLDSVPFEYSIAMGVKRGNTALRDALDAALDARRADIRELLAEYSIPTLPQPATRRPT
ncbi:MAG TPA: quinoprotein dehydrogenase-associated putative ABC transporter substrate-binding protein [Usitatibacter sp.]|jgi:quinoprotein dehydrogenase-associated probable ABC transporter substrate-binding protein|nr:quinoprotein dehydrogenase-associated putative ABC transporter substrate-binding protein [Usitatibacter sp.]